MTHKACGTEMFLVGSLKPNYKAGSERFCPKCRVFVTIEKSKQGTVIMTDQEKI
jgi:hypothetical protein